jgi:hypothetical protein
VCFTAAAVRLNSHKRENEYNDNTMEKMLLFTVSDGTTTKAFSVLTQTVMGALKTERSST